jgi:pilus assembly protein CpaD
MAAMVENPADLVQPRSETPVYAARRTQVLDKYRKGESPATVYPDAAQSKISDVGK